MLDLKSCQFKVMLTLQEHAKTTTNWNPFTRDKFYRLNPLY